MVRTSTTLNPQISLKRTKESIKITVGVVDFVETTTLAVHLTTLVARQNCIMEACQGYIKVCKVV